MDETLPTVWTDITPLAVAGNKWRSATRRETGPSHASFFIDRLSSVGLTLCNFES
jgi:hypothetical protein